MIKHVFFGQISKIGEGYEKKREKKIPNRLNECWLVQK